MRCGEKNGISRRSSRKQIVAIIYRVTIVKYLFDAPLLQRVAGERGNGTVCDLDTTGEVYLCKIVAAVCDGYNAIIGHLVASVKLESYKARCTSTQPRQTCVWHEQVWPVQVLHVRDLGADHCNVPQLTRGHEEAEVALDVKS
jgi:hypothetical protein